VNVENSKQVSKCFSKEPHIRSHRALCSMFMLPEKVSLQLSSEQSTGDGEVPVQLHNPYFTGLRSWTGREFHKRGPVPAKFYCHRP